MAPAPSATGAMWKSKLGTAYPKELIDKLDAEHHRTLKQFRTLPENRRCFDCQALETNWASVNLGVFLCTRCASVHRGLGTHVSKVKSCMGTYLWGPDEIARMREMGNARGLRVYLGKKGGSAPPALGPEAGEAALREFAQKKYEHRLWAVSEEAEETETAAVAATDATVRAKKEEVPKRKVSEPRAEEKRNAAKRGGTTPEEGRGAGRTTTTTTTTRISTPATSGSTKIGDPPPHAFSSSLKVAQPPSDAFFDDFFDSLFHEQEEPVPKSGIDPQQPPKTWPPTQAPTQQTKEEESDPLAWILEPQPQHGQPQPQPQLGAEQPQMQTQTQMQTQRQASGGVPPTGCSSMRQEGTKNPFGQLEAHGAPPASFVLDLCSDAGGVAFGALPATGFTQGGGATAAAWKEKSTMMRASFASPLERKSAGIPLSKEIDWFEGW